MAARPRRGVDYPGTWIQFRAWFADEKACRRYLEKVRWANGFECHACESKKGYWQMSDGWRRCKGAGGKCQ